MLGNRVKSVNIQLCSHYPRFPEAQCHTKPPANPGPLRFVPWLTSVNVVLQLRVCTARGHWRAALRDALQVTPAPLQWTLAMVGTTTRAPNQGSKKLDVRRALPPPARAVGARSVTKSYLNFNFPLN